MISVPIILKKASTYLVFGGLNALLGLVLLPIITRFLSPADYGIVSIFTVTVMFVGLIMRLETQASVKRMFHETDPVEISKVISTSLTISLIMAFAIAILNLFALPFYSTFFGIPKNWVWAIIFLGISGSLSTMIIALYSIKDKPLYVGLWQTCFTALNYALALYLIVIAELKWTGRTWPLVIIGVLQLIFAILIFYLKFKIRLQLSMHRSREMIHYSLPIVSASIGAYFLMSVDRYFISKMVGLESTGVYASASQIIIALVIIYNAFLPTWEVWIFKNLSITNNKNKKRAFLIQFGFIVVFGFLCYIFANSINSVIPYVLGPEFQSASQFIPALSFAVFGRAVYYSFVPLINFSKQNKIFILIMGAMLVTNCILNYIFIKYFGVVGAAYATACSYLIGISIATFSIRKRMSLKSVHIRA